MERQTTKLKTPSGIEFEIKAYLTARERNELRNLFPITYDVATGAPKIGELSAEVLSKSERKIMELAVVSYAGTTGLDLVEKILDGSPEDYDFIAAEASKIANFKPAK